MPTSFKDQTETFANQYTDVIIDFFTHQLTPEQVCKEIGLCVQHETNDVHIVQFAYKLVPESVDG